MPWGLALPTDPAQGGFLILNCQEEGTLDSRWEFTRTALASSPPHPQPQMPAYLTGTQLECVRQHLARHELPHSGHPKMDLPNLRGRAADGSELPAFPREPTVPSNAPAPSQLARDCWDTIMRKAIWGSVLSGGTVLAGCCRHEGLIQGDQAALRRQRTGCGCHHQEHADGTTATRAVTG